jgi:CHAD domain-containing protein
MIEEALFSADRPRKQGAETAPASGQDTKPDANDSGPTSTITNGLAAAATDGAREVEAKFGVSVERVRRLMPADLPLGEATRTTFSGVKLIDDLYFDTADFGILRSGFSFRLRHQGDKAKITIKGLERGGMGAIHSRFELEGEAMPGFHPLDPAGWPKVIQRWVFAMAGEEPKLLPLVRIAHARRAWKVFEGDSGKAFAELVAEEVRVDRPDRASGGSGMDVPVGCFAEIELELLDKGQVDAFEAMVKRLGKDEGLAAASISKLERALDMVASQRLNQGIGSLDVRPDMPMAEASRLLLRRQFTAMLLNEAGSRIGEDIEYVHDMRVASRRATAIIDLAAGHLDADITAPYRKGLRLTRRKLGVIRDLDVALDALRARQAKLPADEAAALERLAERWEQDREAAYAKLLSYLNGKKYRRFLQNFEAFCWAEGEGVLDHPDRSEHGAPSPTQMRHVLPLLILQRYANVRAYEAPLEHPHDIHAELLHDLRIDCKSLRYSLEMAQPLMGEHGGPVLKILKKMQTHLGDLNDAEVTRARLLEMLEDGVKIPAIEVYAEEQEAISHRLRETYQEPWEALVGSEFREALGMALATL